MWRAEWALLELREEETGTPVCMMVVWTWGKQAEGQFGSILEAELTVHPMSCLWRNQETETDLRALAPGGAIH